MLGQPTSTSMAVWGRTSDPGEFVVKYGRAPDALTETSVPTRTTNEHDNMGLARLSGLQPDARYHYQVFVSDRPHGLPGSFLTLPSADDVRNPGSPDGVNPLVAGEVPN